MKVLVTGGAGFIGSHIVDDLIMKGHEVIVVDNLSTGLRVNINEKAKFFQEDIRDKKLSKVFQESNPECVIHHAAQIDVQKSLNDPIYDADVNIIGTINILECCRKYKVRKIIYPSSAAAYGEPQYLGIDEKHILNPISVYGISKLTPEYYLKVYKECFNINYTILRYSNVYGPRQISNGEGGVVSIFVNKVNDNKEVVIFGDGNQSRDFIYVKDVANANLKAIDYGDNQVFNIGTGIQTSINELYDLSLNIFGGRKRNVKYEKSRNGDIIHNYFDISKANTILGFQSRYDLEQGLKETIKFYKNEVI